MNLLKNKNSIYYLILIILVIVGGLIRLNGFVYFGFTAADEYYIIKSVKNILERGLPEFASGGYYVRGILYQYLSAGLMLLGVNDIVALRIIPVIFNLLSIPVVFLIARKITTPAFALVSAFLFTFSVWEIEIARFARFYSPFQFIFLAYIYFLLDVLVNNDHKKFKWLYILTFLGVLFHEEAIFLAALNFLPLYLSKQKKGMIVPLILLLFTAFLTLFGFRNLGVTNHLPSDVVFNQVSGSTLVIPKILLPLILGSGLWTVLFIIPLALFILYMKNFLKKDTGSEEKFYFLIIGIAILLNLFGLALFLLLIFIFSKKIDAASFQKQDLIWFAAFFLITFIFYFLYGAFTSEWQAWFRIDSFSPAKLILLLFNYPDVYEKFLIAWVRPFPRLTMFILISFLLIIYFFLRKSFTKKSVNLIESVSGLMLIILILSFFVTTIVTPYKNLRYWFFIYPLFLVAITFLIYKSASLFKSGIFKYSAALILFAIIFFLSEDHSVKHLKNIDTLEVSFRMNYPQKLAGTYYYKEYYLSAAKQLKENLKNDDLIITTVAPIEYYLPRLDYYYRPYTDVEFKIRSRDKGRREVWTNSSLFYKEEWLTDFINKSKKNIWLITYSGKRPGINEFEKELVKRYSDYLFYTTPEGSLNVYYIKADLKNLNLINK